MIVGSEICIYIYCKFLKIEKHDGFLFVIEVVEDHTSVED